MTNVIAYVIWGVLLTLFALVSCACFGSLQDSWTDRQAQRKKLAGAPAPPQNQPNQPCSTCADRR